MLSKQPESAESELAKTRADLTEKLETLENQVLETAQQATAAVNGTVTTVKEAVNSTADAVQSTVQEFKETFNLARQVRNHPWPMMGAGIGAGFLIGQVFKPTSPVAQTRERTAAGDAVPRADQATPSWPTTTPIWGNVENLLTHSLALAWQGIFAAVFAEVIREMKTQQPTKQTVPEASGIAHRRPQQHEAQPNGRRRLTPK